MKRHIFAIIIASILPFLPSYGQTGSVWTCDYRQYASDIQAYLEVVNDGEVSCNPETFEVGAFVGDECRGVATRVTYSEQKALYMLRIWTNDPSEVITFRLYSRFSGNIYQLTSSETYTFEGNGFIGSIGAPVKLHANISMEENSSVMPAISGTIWNCLYTKYEKDTPMYVSAVGTYDRMKIDNIENFELGAFVDNECRGVSKGVLADSIFLIRVWDATEDVEFRLYDKVSGNIYPLHYDSLNVVDDKIGSIASPTVLLSDDFDRTVLISFYHGEELLLQNHKLPGSALVPPETPSVTGFSFAHWDPELPTLVPDYDAEFLTVYARNSYTVSYIDYDGSLIRIDTVAYESALPVAPTPERTGYTFAGWDREIPATMPAEDITIKALWTINQYALIYIVDGDTVQTDSLDFGTTIEPLDEPTKEGYTFSGWSEIPETMPAHDVIVTGYFTVNQYALTYIVDGDTVQTDSLDYGATIDPLDEPTKEGHTFSGWSEIPETMPAHDVNVTGSFTVNHYGLTYIVDGDTVQTDSLDFGTTIEPLDEPTKEGHTFSGWSKIPETMPAHDVTVTGSFAINQYLVSFVVEGDTVQADSLDFGSTITAPEDPTKEGYTFIGWEPEVDTTVPAHDVTYVAQFTINQYALTYLVDGDTVQTDSLDFGATIEPLDEPTKEGYTFSGWSEIPETMPAYDVTVTGSFVINQYLVSFIVEGDTVLADSLDFGSAIIAPEDPTKEGYTFTGWDPAVDATVPAHDVTYVAQFTINQYALTYIVDGDTVQADSLDYGATIEPLDEPTKEGYTFSGWSEIPEAMPAHDVTVTGSFAINQYLVSFIVEGDTVQADSLDFGSVITAPDDPTKEGYTFTGWDPEVDTTVPAHDVTYVAQFSVNTYMVRYYVGEELVHKDEVEYGASFTLYEYTPEEGYVFNGWIGETYETMPAHDIEYHADIESGINDVAADANDNSTYYDLSGRKIQKVQQGGIIIKRLGDGRVVKILKR